MLGGTRVDPAKVLATRGKESSGEDTCGEAGERARYWRVDQGIGHWFIGFSDALPGEGIVSLLSAWGVKD